MVASLQFGTAASYYARTYYHGGERQLAATWFARAGQFGLADGDTIHADVFERLHAGLDETGRSLCKGAREVEGLDLCFSPGKSVSLAFALTNDEALRTSIVEAHTRAVRAALTVLEDEAIFTRRGHGGLRREKAPLTAALFTHDTARPSLHDDGSIFADPQIHTHAVLLNLCLRGDGTFGGIDTRIGLWKMCAGSVYHASLAHELSALGFSIGEVGPNGTFEIGLPAEARAFFSARRKAIVEYVEIEGAEVLADPTAMAEAALRTRRAKGEQDGGVERFALWQAKAPELGLEPGQCIEDLRRSTELKREAVTEGETIEDRLNVLPEVLTATEAAFPRRELLRQVAVAHVGVHADPAGIVNRSDALVQRDHVREIRRTALDEPIYSTPEMIEVERSVLALAADLAAKPWRGLDRAPLEVASGVAGLSNEQRDAILALAQPTMLAFLEGRAGAGKTQALKPLVRELERAGYRVIAAAQAWRTARMLNEELGIEARAVDAWLASDNAGGRFVDARTVLLVDEAGLLGARATRELLRRVRARAVAEAQSPSGAKLILVGDRKQLQPIAAGAGLKIVGQAIEGAALTAVRRQRDPELRRVVELLSQGEVAPAFELLESQGAIDRQPTARRAIAAAIETWRNQQRARPEAVHLLLARSNASVRALNVEARRVRRAAGEILGEDVDVKAVSPTGQVFVLPLATGDRLRFGARVDALGVINGTSAIVEMVETRGGGHARIVARVGEARIAFDTTEVVDRRGRVRLAHDLAATIASSQGLTAETCTTLLEPALDRNEFFVAASRSRGQTRFILDENAIGLIARSERRLNESREPPTREERDAALLRRLSRERVKTSSLDDPREPKLDEKSPQRELEQQKERPHVAKDRGRGRARGRELDYEL